MKAPAGLSEVEVAARRARGLHNAVEFPSSRPYRQILRENVFTFINAALFGLGFALVLVGRVSDALASVGIISINLLVSLAQEIRAKRALDRIALLTRPHATVVREGGEQSVDPSAIVVDDVLVAQAGDQFVVDGHVLAGQADVDESLLTGESDLVPKRAGDPVFSGTFAVSGLLWYRAEKVGAQSLANQLTVGARAFRRVQTPLQTEILLIIRLAIVLVVYLEFLLALSAVFRGIPLVRSVQMSVVVAGLVPNGLILATTLAYALGAVRISQRGALVQQTNAVESLSNVNVLCLDKTGTLTANRLEVESLRALGVAESEAPGLIGDFVASAATGNRTSEALRAAWPATPRPVAEEVPFSSERRWSGLCYAEEPDQAYVLGAPDAFGCRDLPEAGDWAGRGLRVLLLARAKGAAGLTAADGRPRLPANLEPLALIGLHDRLRPGIQATLAEFASAGIAIKVISGDDPDTVAALARQAGLSEVDAVIHGDDLDALDDADLARVAARHLVFGRIAPRQKQRLVRALRSRGQYVAMVGDGVNDVLSLKEAQLGIAMQSGSQATRAVADLVLLNDSFEVLPYAFHEGQRIFNGMQNVLKIFLTRISYLALLFVSTAIIGGFPLTPKQASLLTLFTVGIPAIAFSLWARPGPIQRGGRVRGVLHFVVPAAFTLSLAALAMYLFHLLVLHIDIRVVPGVAGRLRDIFDIDTALLIGQTALFLVTTLAGLILIPLVEPPFPARHAGHVHPADRRPALLALFLLGLLVVVMAVDPLRAFFELQALSPASYLLIGGVVLAWALALRNIWERRLLDWFLLHKPD